MYVFVVPPTVTVPNQLFGALQYNDVTLQCDIEAFPRPMMFWTKSRLTMDPAEHTMIVSNNKFSSFVQEGHAYKYTMKLIVNNLKVYDFGSYVCHAKSSYGDTRASIKLYGRPALYAFNLQKLF